MFDDIAKVDRVHNPEPLKTRRGQGNGKRNNKEEQSPAPSKEMEPEESGNEDGSERLLDIRI